MNEQIRLVDDDDDLLDFLRGCLAEASFQVTTSRNGLEALAVAEKRHFDLIVTDVQTDGIAGLTGGNAVENLMNQFGGIAKRVAGHALWLVNTVSRAVFACLPFLLQEGFPRSTFDTCCDVL